MNAHPNTPKPGNGHQTGVVFKKSTGNYWVQSPDGEVVCTLSSKLRRELVYPTADPASRRRRVVEVREIDAVDPVAIGDRVAYIPAAGGGGMIVNVMTRRNELSRRAAGKKPVVQTIAANVDQVIPVFAAANPAPKWNLLDRYLAAAEWAGIPAVICMTKLDLLDGPLERESLEAECEVYRRLGYTVLLTSAYTEAGLAEFRDVLTGRLTVFIGKSGVGKSSLLNALQPDLGLRVKTISQATGKGRHTTTHLEMFPLVFGGWVIDTPGMREFSLDLISDVDLAGLFPELRPLIGACKFGLKCTHTHEPGCAFREAVASGEVHARRYESFLRIKEE